MISKVNLFFVLFFCAAALLKAGNDKEILPEISPSEIPGGEITRKDYYDRKTLWGYIDGGADIYLEYGFEKLVVEEIRWQKQSFRVEVFRMNTPKNAFGIFSVSKSSCPVKDSLTEFSCITPYQTVLFKDLYYVSIINESGSDEAISLSSKLAKMLLIKMPSSEFSLPRLLSLPAFSRYQKEAKYFIGKLGLQNCLPEMADQFEMFRDYTIDFLPVESEAGYFNLFIIKLSGDKDVDKFCSLNGLNPEGKKSIWTEKNGIYKALYTNDPDRIIYVESTLKPEQRTTYLNAVNGYVR